MLNIKFGITPDRVILNTTEYFLYDMDWQSIMLTDFTKRVVRDIDQSEVISARIIESPVLGAITPEELSGGVKAILIAMYKDDDGMELMLERMGENCYPFLYEVGRLKDIVVHTELLPIFDFSSGLSVRVTNTGGSCKVTKRTSYRVCKMY